MSENTFNSITGSRSGCALHGALVTLSEMKDVVPIVHGNGGCAVHRHIADRTGAAGEGAIGGLEVPSTNITEKQVVFGGGSRLREQIKNTVKTVNGKLYVVLGSCESAMVGDDIIGMAREAAEQSEPVTSCDAAGFYGTARHGYVRVFKNMIEAVPEFQISLSHEAAAINIFGIIPREDVRFKGDLTELKRIIEGFGLRTNLFFGYESGAEQLAGIPGAKLNLVFSKWGIEIAEKLQSKYGIPHLFYPSLPCGFEDVKTLVLDITKILHLEEKAAAGFIEKERASFEYFLRSIRERLYGQLVGTSVAVVGSEGEVRQIGGFLSRYLEAEVAASIITDGKGPEEMNDGYVKNDYYTNDAVEIRGLLEKSGAHIIFGSALEKGISEGFCEVSYPVFEGAVLSKTYTGTNGAITLAEDYIAAVSRKNDLTKSRLANTIRQNNI